MSEIIPYGSQVEHEARTLREKWCGVVAGLVYPHKPDQAAAAMCKYLGMLADLPDGAFTRRSAEHVATQPRRMAIPSYDELGRALRLWWRDNNPQLAIAQEKPDGWDDRDEVWLAYWHRRQAEGFAPIPSLKRPPGGLTWREHVASLVRSNSRRAWSVIEVKRDVAG